MANRDIPEINAGSMADIAFLLLIFFLVTTTMDKDTAYVRSIPKKVLVKTPPVDVEKRNICAILANSKNQLMVRGELMSNPDDISERVIEWYTTNEKQNDVTNNFPMYSRISMAEIEAQIASTTKDAEAMENTPNASADIIDFKWKQVQEWENKKKALKLYGRNELPEIQFQAHVRIEVQKATAYELFAKIQSELEEAIFTLRDKASLEIFGESYGVIKKRYDANEGDKTKQAQAREDKDKLDLLKILYPDRFIEVTPKK
ncbi:MAG: biopolymer transporter ExbD [Bacteroidetes bacterium]|nr:MAG: biopolymer transporter ExbD [Bacteroidota bacterium]TNE96867.1 MAG: biopolymer transporter ExbD [Bacteroidota bacterium]